MRRFTKHHKKMRIAFIATAFVMSLGVAAGFPWFRDSSRTDNGYYKVMLNGIEIGAAASEEEVEEAFLSARLSVEKKSESFVYMDPELVIEKEDRIFGDRNTVSELEDKMYEVLASSTVNAKQKGYVVDIDGYTVVLSTKEEVVKLFEAAKDKFDKEDTFYIDLVEDKDSLSNTYTTNLVKAGTKAKESITVLSAQGGTESVSTPTEEKTYNGVTALEFDENVKIVQTFVSNEQIMSLEDAVNAVTKDKEANKVYEVVSGDTLSGIAKKFDIPLSKIYQMNEGLNENSVIDIGDLIVVTVPEPELSVIVIENKTYEESYSLPVKYVYNEKQFSTYEKVIQEGSDGYREVNADISYRNNLEVSREVLSSKEIKAPVERIIEIGTLTPPTYIKPVSGGTITDLFGYRWGRLHAGVDWGCSTGTAVRASASGKVIQSGWRGTYGYCIEIRHSDGSRTKYAHLSKMYVSVGEYVDQGERIALSGNTGFSTGPHLHFEIIIGGSPVNPLNYVK